MHGIGYRGLSASDFHLHPTGGVGRGGVPRRGTAGMRGGIGIGADEDPDPDVYDDDYDDAMGGYDRVIGGDDDDDVSAHTIGHDKKTVVCCSL